MLDFELALDVLGGPLFYRLLITGGPIDERLAEGVAELILRGFAPGDVGRDQVHENSKGATRMKIHAIQTGTVASHDRLARGRRPRPASPPEHDPRSTVDGTAPDLRLRDRAPGGRHRR